MPSRILLHAVSFLTPVALAVVAVGGSVRPAHALFPLPAIPPAILRCSNILQPVVTAMDAVPFLRRYLDRKLSEGWFETFDMKLYRKLRAEYAAMDTLPLEQWGFPESSLAYLETLMEKAGGFKLSLADSLLDDPSRIRRFQVLVQELDLTQPITRYELHRLIENAYLVDGRFDLKIFDLRNLSSKKIRDAVRHHVRMELTKSGVTEYFRSKGFLDEKGTFGQTLLRVYEHPVVSAGMYLPSWTEFASFMPGYLPTVRWVRLSQKDLQGFLEHGIDGYLPQAEPAIRRALAFQTTYDFTQTFVAVWAGLFTLGYTSMELFDLDEKKATALMQQSAAPAFTELRASVISPSPQTR